ncbi:MAG: serine protein kinase RIO [Nanoarchaeota archaeon]|nr:serine protein kinase RIO [Nanoarchaeota archaeon]
MAKKTKEEWKVFENVFDQFTIRTLQSLSGKGHFDGLKSPISLGKEANVFTAEKGDDLVCVKIYRLESTNFNAMYKYIRNDLRFEGLSHQRRKIIFAWCQREYRNMMLVREAGVNCPKPIAFANNVLLMEFIGDEMPAPMLKDAPPRDVKKFYDAVIDNMKKTKKAGLAHGDLSEYNILNHNEEPVFIDFSHGTLLKSPNADELLERDVKNICRYFKKLGLDVTEEKIKKSLV